MHGVYILDFHLVKTAFRRNGGIVVSVCQVWDWLVVGQPFLAGASAGQLLSWDKMIMIILVSMMIIILMIIMVFSDNADDGYG